jgi:hypothetical protein
LVPVVRAVPLDHLTEFKAQTRHLVQYQLLLLAAGTAQDRPV